MQGRRKVPTNKEPKKSRQTNFPFKKGESVKVRISEKTFNAKVLGKGKTGYVVVRIKEVHKRVFKHGGKEKLVRLEAEIRDLKIKRDSQGEFASISLIEKIFTLDKEIGLLLNPAPVIMTRTKSVPISSVIKQKEQPKGKTRKGQVSKTQSRVQRRKTLIEQAMNRASGWRDGVSPKRVRRELQRKGIFGVNPKPGRKIWRKPR
ncbi:MAG: hypothetical protein Q7S21_03080 [archaeon]|nr:hypothetical protein [archaeon]